MGYALAASAVSHGAETVLITGPSGLTPPLGAKVVTFETTAQLHRAVIATLKKADCLIMAAAPADYRPAKPAGRKLKKDQSSLELGLEPTVDILKDITSGGAKPPLVVGFALETDHPVENARKKLKEKKLDMIVLNRVGDATGFDSDTNEVTILRPGCRPTTLPRAKKSEIAERLLDLIASML